MSTALNLESDWVKIGPDEVAGYAELAQDFNPIHLDPKFAAGTPFGRPIVHGTRTLAELWPHLERLGDGPLAGASVAFRFVKPVFVGDRVKVRLGPPEDSARVPFQIVRGDETVAIEGTIAMEGESR